MTTRLRYCGELLSNAGFETAGTGGADIFASWTETAGDGAVADETGSKHAGAHAVKLTAGATSNTTVYQAVTVRPGFTYDLTFYTRGDGTHDGKYSIYDATNAANIVAATDTGVTGTSYTLVTKQFTAPAGCVSVRITLGCPVENGGVAYFDDASVLPADFAFDAEAELGDEPVGNEWEALDGSLHKHNRCASGRRLVWSVTAKGIEPAEREMLRAAFDAALLAGCVWMAWSETTATTVRARPGTWRQRALKRADGTAVYDVAFAVREETPS